MPLAFPFFIQLLSPIFLNLKKNIFTNENALYVCNISICSCIQ